MAPVPTCDVFRDKVNMENEENSDKLKRDDKSKEVSHSKTTRNSPEMSLYQSPGQIAKNYIEKCSQSDVPWGPTKSFSIIYSRSGTDTPLCVPCSHASRSLQTGEKITSPEKDPTASCQYDSMQSTTTTLLLPAISMKQFSKEDSKTYMYDVDRVFQKAQPAVINAEGTPVSSFSESSHTYSTGIVESVVESANETSQITSTRAQESNPVTLVNSSGPGVETTSPNFSNNTFVQPTNSQHTVNTIATQTVSHPQNISISPLLHPAEMNFCRFTILILRSAPRAVRTYFDSRHPPLQLMRDLAVNKDALSALKGRVISSHQWKTLYPPSEYVNSKQFDVTLLILLLRYMTKVPVPDTGFDKLPPQTDNSVGADLARIKHYRNLVAHSNNAKLTEADFNDYWAEIESAIGRLGGQTQLLETRELKTSLIEEKDREILLEIRQLRAQLQETIPQNIKEQIQDKLDLWSADDAKFHETRASTEVQNLIQSKKCVAVVGNSGAGKSAIVHHVALKMQNKGYSIVPVKVPNEILQYFNKNSDQIFVIDDPCGEKTLDFHLAKEWKRHEGDIMRFLTKTDNTRLLLSCRLSISNTSHYKDIVLFQHDQCKVINLKSNEFSLTAQEKRAIYKSHTNVDFRYEEDILNIHDCFPLLCKLISTKKTFMKNPQEFLKFPDKEYFLELDLLRQHQTPYDYCALVLCIFFDNGFQPWYLQKGKDYKIDEIFEFVYDECCLDQGTSRKRIKQALDGMTNVYISNEDDTYRLLHSTLTEIIASHFAKESLHILIKFGPMWILDSRLRNQGQISSKSESKYFLMLEDQHKDVFCERIVDQLAGKNHNTLFNFCFPDYQLEALLFHKLKSNGKLASILHTRNRIGNLRFFNFLELEKKQVKTLDIEELRSIDLSSIEKITISDGRIPSFYEKVSAKLLLEINKSSFLHWLIGAGWTNFLVHSLEAVDTKLRNELLQSKKSAFLLSLISGNLDMVKLCLKLLGPDFNSKFTCFLCKQLCDCDTHLNNCCPLEGLNFITIPCIEGKKDIFEFLFNEGICSRNDVNTFVYFDNQSVTPLTAACKFGHIDIVRLLTANGANVNFTDKNGNTPLAESCYNGHDQVMKILLENGANLEERCCLDFFNSLYIKDCFEDEYKYEGWSALWWACYRGHSSIVSFLLDKGANVHNTNKAGKTPLWAAIQGMNYDVVVLLIEKNVKINEQDNHGRTPIWWASNVGQIEILKLFIERKGNVNTCDSNDISPLYTACYRNHVDCVKLLIDHGADINTKHSLQPSPLIGACCNENKDLISLLIRSGADVNYSFKGICSPLSITTWSSFQDGMTILINNGAEINMTFDNGKTVLIQCIFNHPNVVERLPFLLHDLQTVDDFWFHFCPGITSCDLLDIVSLLVKYGSDLNAKDDNGLTALMGVVQHNLECTKFLLEHGACVDATDEDCRSALHYACLVQRHEELSLLIDYGADINARDKFGFAPLHYACELIDEQTLDILLSNGANVNVRGNQWMTPLFYLLYHKAMFKINKNEDLSADEDGKNLTSNRIISIALKLLNHGARVKDCQHLFPFDEFFLELFLKDEKLVNALLEKMSVEEDEECDCLIESTFI